MRRATTTSPASPSAPWSAAQLLPRADIVAGRRADRACLLGRALQRLLAGAPAGGGGEARPGCARAVRCRQRSLAEALLDADAHLRAAGARRPSAQTGAIKAWRTSPAAGFPENLAARAARRPRRAHRPRRRGRRRPCSAGSQRAGNLDDAEMLRTFNCGIGLMLVVARKARPTRCCRAPQAAGEAPFAIGEIEPGRGVKSASQGQRRGGGRALLGRSSE